MAKKKKQQNKKNQTASQNQKGDFKLFLKAAWSIIRNKSDTENYFTGAVLSFLISRFLNIIALLLGLAALYGAVEGVYAAVCSLTASLSGVFNGACQVLLAVLIALFALILRGVANEVERETDLNHLLALFSGITGFITLLLTLREMS